MRIEKTDTFIEHDIIVDSTKIGTVELCPERHEISRLIIFEPYQNKGYGTQVVQKLVQIGYKSLWVRSDNPRAIHVYEKCGFKRGNTCMFEMMVDKAETEGERMTKEEMMDLLERAKILLKATKDLLEKQSKSYYVLNLLEETAFYDGAERDGICLKDDIDYWFYELEEQTKTKSRETEE